MADWLENGPGDDDIVSQFPQNERAARSATKTNFGADHHEDDDANVGKHETVQMLPQSTPTAVVGQGHFYAKDIGAGVIELFFQDAAGNETQLTTEGNINLSDLLIVTAKLADGVLSADAAGRAKMADGYLSADAAGRAKMADGYTNTAKLADGALSADTTGRAKMADGFMTTPKLADGVLSANAAGRAKVADDFITQRMIGDDQVFGSNIVFSFVSSSGLVDVTAIGWYDVTVSAPASPASTTWRLVSATLGTGTGSDPWTGISTDGQNIYDNAETVTISLYAAANTGVDTGWAVDVQWVRET